MTGLPTLVRDLAGEGLEVRTASPRAADHLLLELRDQEGRPLPAQWYADPGRARQVAAATGPPGLVRRPLPGVVTQRAGTDRRLTGLRPLLALPGSTLVSHRPERRAVVKHGPCFTKAVRPGRAAGIAAALDRAAAGGVPAPRVVDCDDRAGTVTTSELAGITLHEAWPRPRPAAALRRVGTRVGELLRVLHALPPDGLAEHDAQAELATTARWLEHAAAYGVLPLSRDTLDGLLTEAAARLASARPARAVLHRDLHDKQVVLDGDDLDPEVRLLDLDTLAVGDPALDLANLLVHLELRVHQGWATPAAAEEVAAGVLDGYAPDDAVRRTLGGYALTTRLRLGAVYAFRPGRSAAALALLIQPLGDRLV